MRKFRALDSREGVWVAPTAARAYCDGLRAAHHSSAPGAAPRECGIVLRNLRSVEERYSRGSDQCNDAANKSFSLPNARSAWGSV